MPGRLIWERISRSGAAAIALAATGDFSGLARRLRQQVTGIRRPLPASLRPAPRTGLPLHVPGDLLIMAGPALERNGAPMSQLELARGLVSRGWRVLTLATRDGPLASAYREAGLDLEIWPSLSPGAAVPAWYERDIAGLANAIRGRQPGLVYANTLDMFPVIDAAQAAGLASIWNIREGEPWQTRLADRHPAIAARALAAFAYPQAVIHVANATTPIWSAFTPATRTHVIHNAFAQESVTPATDPTTRRQDEFRIVSAGTICARKGQLDLVKAQRRLPADLVARVRIVFVGREDAEYAAAMRAEIGPDNPGIFTWAGEISDVTGYFRQADALVHCARAEAFPRVFLEAAEAGLPIIATRAGGAEERLRDRESALLYDPGDIGALAANITTLARSPAARQKLVITARRDLIDRWTSDDMIDAYERVIHNALARANL